MSTEEEEAQIYDTFKFEHQYTPTGSHRLILRLIKSPSRSIVAKSDIATYVTPATLRFHNMEFFCCTDYYKGFFTLDMVYRVDPIKEATIVDGRIV